MKMLWCWRCKADMPMLDEEEFKRTMSRRLREKGLGREQFLPMLAEYEQITGVHETNPNAVYHHRLLMYGPACNHCGKPLRTPQAKLCGSCMQPRDGSSRFSGLLV